MKLLCALLSVLLLPGFAAAIDLPEPHTPAAKAPEIAAPRSLTMFDDLRPLIDVATVSVSTTNPAEDLTWRLSRVDTEVLIGKLQQLKYGPHPYDPVFAAAPAMDEAYDGLVIEFKMLPGAEANLPALWFDKGTIRTKAGANLHTDPGRELEYWIFGASNNRAAQVISLKSLPVFTFEQCLNLGNMIVQTDPRQCVMPNEIVMLDLGLAPTVDPLTVTSFDACLETGLALMNTFPRRCLTKGGKLVAEPPRRPDGSIILPGQN